MYNIFMNTNPTKNSLKIERFQSVEETNRAAISYLNDLLAQYVDRPVLLLLAGGSSVTLYDGINPEYLSMDLTVTVTDERFSNEVDINNFAILQATDFYNELIQVDAFCINTQPNAGETMEDCARRFERNLKEWKRDFPKGVVLAVYGMGKDGHTGGMIPGVLGEAEFNQRYNTDDVWVSSMDAGDKIEYSQRFSTTIPFMKNQVDHALFYVTGTSKKEALDKAIDGNLPYHKIPATVMSHMKDVVLFTDIAE
ncbi:MAG: hypothetical protein FGM57_01560 [Candidatus Taylorbacteria bacterium]|nr:hypothetical protein [Candidatus Taylorbacteria bacterium]